MALRNSLKRRRGEGEFKECGAWNKATVVVRAARWKKKNKYKLCNIRASSSSPMMANYVLLESPCFSAANSPQRSSQASSQAYILSIANLPFHYAASSSPPSNVIDIFDKSTLQRVDTLQAHATATTSLRVVENVGGISGTKTLMSSGKDGLVKFWDLRSGSCGIESEA